MHHYYILSHNILTSHMQVYWHIQNNKHYTHTHNQVNLLVKEMHKLVMWQFTSYHYEL